MLYNALNSMKVKQLGAGKFSDGQGLWVHKKSKDRGRWFIRLVVQGSRREMGLGRWPDVSLAEARERAALARKQLRDGVDPIQARRQERYKPKPMTVAEAIESCFEARKAELKNDGKAGQWLNPIARHVIPQIGSLPIENVDQLVIRDTLAPIWHEKADTARKCLNRLSLTLKHAAALGIDADLQATLKARALLGKQRHTPKHIASIPYEEAPDFYRFLCSKDTMTAYALRFLMLTATRAGEVRFATRDEIEGDVWTIPAARTKQAKQHRVPLSTEALKVLEDVCALHNHDLIFPTRSGKPMSDAAMAKFMKDNGYDARPHGLRSTFRTWSETTSADWETKEMCLGHTVGGKVERAYQRSDLLDKRADLLEMWRASLCHRPC